MSVYETLLKTPKVNKTALLQEKKMCIYKALLCSRWQTTDFEFGHGLAVGMDETRRFSKAS